VIVDSNLTADDLDWLRKLKAAAGAQRNLPSIPMNIAARLGAFDLARPTGPGSFAITSKGLEALMDQDMRDAEDR